VYAILDSIDEQMAFNGYLPLSQQVELNNLSGMVGNLIGDALVKQSGGLFKRNKPHKYPDLVAENKNNKDLEIKMALETNMPKGHLKKEGNYIIFRYVLGDKRGNFTRGKDHRGDTIWIWEVKVGNIAEDNFSCSNTDGDSGKTAYLTAPFLHGLSLVYYNKKFLPYAKRRCAEKEYLGFN
jgi:hypothetical protein